MLLTDPELSVAAAGATGVGVVGVTAGLVSTGAELPVATVDSLPVEGSCEATGVVSAGTVVPDAALSEPFTAIRLRAASFRAPGFRAAGFRAAGFGDGDLRPTLALCVVAVFEFAIA